MRYTRMHSCARNLLSLGVLATTLTCVLAPAAFAASEGGFSAGSPTAAMPAPTPGGYTGPGPTVMTVKQALSMRDDAAVSLRGNIVQRLADETYVFQDATGSIHVDIDHKKWEGRQVGPNDIVELQGELDKDWNSVEVDVDRLTVVGK